MSSKKIILDLLYSVKKEGIENLINFLSASTYFTDPASCQDYNAYDGGLADHSLNVYQNLLSFRSIYEELEDLEDSLKIVGLLHDLSLAGTFQKSNKNTPMKGADGKNKKDQNGKIIFIEKESYDYCPESQLPYPEGQLSAMIIKKYIKLTKLEDLAIQWHRGVLDISERTRNLLVRAQKAHPLILLTFLADQQAILYQGSKDDLS